MKIFGLFVLSLLCVSAFAQVEELNCQTKNIKEIRVIALEDHNLTMVKVNGVSLPIQSYQAFKENMILIKSESLGVTQQFRTYLEKSAQNQYVVNRYKFCDSYYEEEKCAQDELILLDSETANCLRQ